MSTESITFQDLVDHVDDQLDASRRAIVERVIQHDPKAVELMLKLRLLIAALRATDTPEPSERIRYQAWAAAAALRKRILASFEAVPSAARIVATLLFDSRSHAASLGLRGDGEEYHLTYRSNAADIDLLIGAEDRAGTGHGSIIGKIATQGGATSGDVRLVSVADQRVKVRTDADDSGMFVIRCPLGQYELEVVVSDVTIVVPEIDISGAAGG